MDVFPLLIFLPVHVLGLFCICLPTKVGSWYADFHAVDRVYTQYSEGLAGMISETPCFSEDESRSGKWRWSHDAGFTRLGGLDIYTFGHLL